MKAAREVLAVALLLSSSVAQSQTVEPFVINASKITRDARGGCSVQLTLENKFGETLKVYGSIFMTDLNGVSLADTSFIFPPAIPGGKSLTDATFYSSSIAGGECPAEFDLRLVPSICDIVGTDRIIRDEYCKRTVRFEVRRRTPTERG